jgi:alcohol dehydrogenase
MAILPARLTAAAVAHSRGAAQVVVIDTQDNRAQRAVVFGASNCLVWNSNGDEVWSGIADVTEGRGADLVMDFSGSPTAVQTLPTFCRIGASIIVVGSVVPTQPVQLQPMQIVTRLLRIEGVHNYGRQDLLEAITVLAEYHTRYPFRSLVEKSYSLAEAETAVREAEQLRPVRVARRP